MERIDKGVPSLIRLIKSHLSNLVFKSASNDSNPNQIIVELDEKKLKTSLKDLLLVWKRFRKVDSELSWGRRNYETETPTLLLELCLISLQLDFLRLVIFLFFCYIISNYSELPTANYKLMFGGNRINVNSSKEVFLLLYCRVVARERDSN